MLSSGSGLAKEAARRAERAKRRSVPEEGLWWSLGTRKWCSVMRSLPGWVGSVEGGEGTGL